MALYIGGTKVKLNVLYGDYAISGGKLLWANPDLYLKSSGTQYIDTGFSADGNTTYEIKLKTGDVLAQWFFGQDNGYSIAAQSFYESIWFYGNNGSSRYNLEKNNIYTLKTYIENSSYYKEGNGSVSEGKNVEEFSCPGTFGLFGHYRGGMVKAQDLTIYYCKLYDNGTLVRNLVPVPAGLQIGSFVVPSNGMFDIVEQKFYANQGTGKFEYGRDE